MDVESGAAVNAPLPIVDVREDSPRAVWAVTLDGLPAASFDSPGAADDYAGQLLDRGLARYPEFTS